MLLPVPPDSTVAYIIMQFCHVCGMQSFGSGPLFQIAALQQAYKTAWPKVRPSPPVGRHCAAGAGQGHVQGGRAPVFAAGAGHGQLPAAPAPATATSRGAARPSSLPAPALAVVAVVYIFFATAVPAAGARRGHLPRALQRRCCGPLLRCGRPHRWRPPRPRLRRHCSRRNSTVVDRCRGTNSFSMLQHCTLFDMLSAASVTLRAHDGWSFVAARADARVSAALSRSPRLSGSLLRPRSVGTQNNGELLSPAPDDGSHAAAFVQRNVCLSLLQIFSTAASMVVTAVSGSEYLFGLAVECGSLNSQ